MSLTPSRFTFFCLQPIYAISKSQIGKHGTSASIPLPWKRVGILNRGTGRRPIERRNNAIYETTLTERVGAIVYGGRCGGVLNVLSLSLEILMYCG